MAKIRTTQSRKPCIESSGICFEPLEPRLLLSGSWGAGAEALSAEVPNTPGSNFAQAPAAFDASRGHADAGAAHQGSSSPVVDLLAQAPVLNAIPAVEPEGDTDAKARELVFVDAGIQDYVKLVDDLMAVSAEGRDVEVVVLEASRDGIAQISETLAGRQDLDAVHFLTHGNEGTVQLGDTLLNSSNLSVYADVTWKRVTAI